MRRCLIALSLTAALMGAATAPVFAERGDQDRLDTGQVLGNAWATTARFDALEARGRDDVRFTSGDDAWRIRAEGDPRALAELRFFVEDGRLVVGRRKADDDRRDTGKATVYITAPSLRSAGAAGSGSLNVDRLSGNDVRASLAGSGEMAVGAMDARELSASVAGSGSMSLSGQTDQARFSVAGSGDVDGRRFTAAGARASVAGSGNVSFRSSGAVKASLVGSGNVTVTGTTDCTQSRVGSGRLLCSS